MMAFKQQIEEHTVFFAPEVWEQQLITFSRDIWAVGITILFMVYNCDPFYGDIDGDYDEPDNILECMEKFC